VRLHQSSLAGHDSDDDNIEAEGWVISSESCGFLSIGARYVREVFPGEIVEMTREGIKTIDIIETPDKKSQAFCIFEYVYFARSDSIFEGGFEGSICKGARVFNP
jgi:amidophosphoribosyltransferase